MRKISSREAITRMQTVVLAAVIIIAAIAGAYYYYTLPGPETRVVSLQIVPHHHNVVAMQAELAAFTAETGIEVQMTSVSLDQEKLMTSLMADVATYDIMQMNDDWIIGAMEYLVPLNDVIPEIYGRGNWTTFSWDMFTLSETYDWMGEAIGDIYGEPFTSINEDQLLMVVPNHCDATVMSIYQPDLLEAEGITDPPYTWDEFLEAAEALHNPPDMYGSTWSGNGRPAYFVWISLFYSTGGTLFTEDMRPNFNKTETGVATTQFLIDLSEFCPEGVLSFDRTANIAMLASGKAATGILAWWSIPSMADPEASAIVDQYVIITPPYKTVRSEHVGAYGWCISENARDMEATEELFRWLMRPERFAATNLGPPGLVEAQDEWWEREDIQEIYGPWQDELQYAVDHSVGLTPFVGWEECYNVIIEELTAAWTGEKTAEEAMQDAAERCIPYLEPYW